MRISLPTIAATGSEDDRPRPITPPPPPAVHAMDALPELVEFSEGVSGSGEAFSLVFWIAIRSLLKWAPAPPGDRSALFSGVLASDPDLFDEVLAGLPDLRGPLEQIGHLRSVPDLVAPPAAAAACMELGLWAEQRELLRSAAYLYESAAYTVPDPMPANFAGRLRRRLGEYARSELWYLRAIELAREAQVPEEVVRGHLGYGFLRFTLGEYGDAMAHYRTAADVARKRGNRAQAAQASHDILTICSDVRTWRDGEKYARRALSLYPVHHPRIPAFVHDVAFLMIRNAFPGPALELLEAVHPLIPSPGERVVVSGNLARAAAALGQRRRYEEFAEEVVRLAARNEEGAARGVFAIAEGARALGDWDRAAILAARTAEVAERRHERTPARLARALLREIGARSLPPAQELTPRSVSSLADDCIQRVRRWTATPRGAAVRILEHTPERWMRLLA